MQEEELDYAVGRQYGIPMVLRRNMVLFALEHASALVQACAQLECGILGIDAFRHRDGVIEPDTGNILDLSELYQQLPWTKFRLGSYEAAKEFLQQLDANVDLLEFVLTEQ